MTIPTDVEEMMKDWPQVSPRMHTALIALLGAIDILNKEDPRCEEYSESFVEILMNFYPANKSGFCINPHPVLAVHPFDSIQ